MADESKSAKKNKQRAQKRQQARIEKIKQDGLVEQILEREDPVMALKKKLQQAKDNKDHKLAAEIRKQIWMAQDQAAGYSVPKEELEEHHVENEPQAAAAAAAAAKPSPIQVTNRDPKNTPAQQTETSSSLNPLEKRLRNLKKKLQQINSLKEKQEKGETLEDMQIEKLKTEEDLIEEINEIESALAGVRL